MQATSSSDQPGVGQSLEVQNRPVPVERIDPAILQLIAFLFPCQPFEGMKFLALLCRRATEKQLAMFKEPVAVLTFHGIAALCAEPDWPWGYHATQRYFILFQALGVLIRRRRNRITEVLIPLGMREEPLTCEHLLEQLCNLQKKTSHTHEYKDKKLVQLIERVKNHIEVYGLGIAGDSDQEWFTSFDSAPLLPAQERIIEVMRSERIPLAKCKRIAGWLCANQVPQLLRDALLAEGRLSERSGDSEAFAWGERMRYQCQQGDSRVEVLSLDVLSPGDSEKAMGDSGEDTEQLLTSQNRPGAQQHSGQTITPHLTSRSQSPIFASNQVVADKVGDCEPRIDSDSNISSNISSKKGNDIEATPLFAFQPDDYQRLNARDARDLAIVVEQRPEAFRAYIDLSKRCSQTAIRAAVINMLTHTYFPDETGTMDASQDGNMSNGWGRPENPGKWVFSNSKLYGQQGIPEVMRVLLTRCEGLSYQDIERDLKALLKRGFSPAQFWAQVQAEVAHADAERLLDAQPEAHPTEEQDAPARGSLTSRDALAIVERINREGSAYGITAHVRPQPGKRFEVEMMQEVNGKVVSVPKEVRCEDDWAAYLALLEEVQALH